MYIFWAWVKLYLKNPLKPMILLRVKPTARRILSGKGGFTMKESIEILNDTVLEASNGEIKNLNSMELQNSCDAFAAWTRSC